MQIELTDSRLNASLRDYFLRLGAAVHTEREAVHICFAEGLLAEDESPEMYLRTWVRTNRAEGFVRVERVGEASQPASGFGQTPPPRLGELLVSKGFITEKQLSQALVESRQTGDVLGRVLVRRGYVFESELARVLAEQWSIPYVNLALIGVDRSTLRLISPEAGRRFAAVPVHFVGAELRVAFADPSDPDTLAEVRRHANAPIQPAIAELSDIEAVWRTVTT